MRSLADRLFDSCIPEPNSGCWIWDGSFYGRQPYIIVNSEKVHAKVASINEFIGNLEDRPKIKNRCLNNDCINPHHFIFVPNGFCFNGHNLKEHGIKIKKNGTKFTACRTCINEKQKIRSRERNGSKIGKITKCAHCGGEFQIKGKTGHIYCSKSCSKAACTGSTINKDASCVGCGTTFKKTSHLQTFCSKACWNRIDAKKRRMRKKSA